MKSRLELRHVGSGRYSHVFQVSDGARKVMMKLSFYRDDTLNKFAAKAQGGDAEGARRIKAQDSIAVSSVFGRISNELMQQNVSPHFMVTYCDVDVKNFAPKIMHLLQERMKELTPANLKYNNVCFLEPFDGDLTKFLQNHNYNEHTLRCLIFQILYTLACLQKHFPGFRHNDLSTNNVLMKKSKVDASYTFAGTTWYVKHMPILVAFSDYDFLHVPQSRSLQNERVLNKRYKVGEERNVSYDSHFFLKSVYKCILRHMNKYAQTLAFLKSLSMSTDDRLASEMPELEPAKLLLNPYFAPLLKKREVSKAYSGDAFKPPESSLVTDSMKTGSMKTDSMRPAGSAMPGSAIPGSAKEESIKKHTYIRM